MEKNGQYQKLWKDVEVTSEEQELVDKIIFNGAGRSLPEDQLNLFHAAKEWDMEIETRVGKTLVHMYSPIEEVEEDTKLPLFINLHGGGFVKGRRDQDIVFSRNICSRAGVLLADVDYIPAPMMRYPGQVYAVYDVLQYFADHAEELHVNRDKIALGGHSAGGSLTAGAVVMAIEQGSFVPALQILDYFGVDSKGSCPSLQNIGKNPKLPVWKMELYNKLYLDPEKKDDLYCNALTAPKAILEKEPPTLALYCDNDIFVEEDEAFAYRLIHLGVPVTARRFFHSNHGFVIQRTGEFAEAEEMIIKALKSM